MLSELAARLWISRRLAPPEPASGYRIMTVTSQGDSGRQVPGFLPQWPADWQRGYPLDPAVFGAVPRVRGELWQT